MPPWWSWMQGNCPSVSEQELRSLLCHGTRHPLNPGLKQGSEDLHTTGSSSQSLLSFQVSQLEDSQGA